MWKESPLHGKILNFLLTSFKYLLLCFSAYTFLNWCHYLYRLLFDTYWWKVVATWNIKPSQHVLNWLVLDQGARWTINTIDCISPFLPRMICITKCTKDAIERLLHELKSKYKFIWVCWYNNTVSTEISSAKMRRTVEKNSKCYM